MEYEKSNFALNLKDIRKYRKLTQDSLAKKAGVSPGSVAQWERGVGCPRLDSFMEVCHVLNVTPNDLLKGGKVWSQRTSNGFWKS